MRIYEALQEQPRTAKQLAAALGLVTNRLYYHLRILQSAGVIEPSGSYVSGRFAQQVFSAPHRVFDRDLISDADPEDRAALFSAMFKATADEVRDVVFEQAETQPQLDLRLTRGYVRTTPAGAEELWASVTDAMVKAWSLAGGADAGNYRFVVSLYQPAHADVSTGDEQ